MLSSNVYLLFNHSRCRPAVSFYAKCFGASVEFFPYSGAPGSEAKGAKPDDVMHVELNTKGLKLMASDCPAGDPAKEGSNFSIALTCESAEEQDKLFAALSEGGKPSMPPQDMFWGDRFAMFTDPFGINWMLSYRAEK